MWGLIILLVPTRGLRLAYAVTVGAYAGISWRKFAYAAYARVFLFRKCLRGYSPCGFFDLSHSSNVRKTKRHQWSHQTFGSLSGPVSSCVSAPCLCLLSNWCFWKSFMGGMGTHVAITKFAYISPTATPTRAYAKNRLNLIFCCQLLLYTDFL